MIKKLDKFDSTEASIYHVEKLYAKINEIIDVLNAIVVDTKDGTFIDGSKKAEPADPYAEQRKWIGKVCRFWDVEGEECVYSVLRNINEKEIYPFTEASFAEYKHCEAVKPDDDIIYKGEQ